jgi:hypothetical protein
MRELYGRRMPTRVKGREAFVRRIAALAIAVQRYGRHRASSRDDVVWAARTLDAVLATLTIARGARAACAKTGQTE